MHRRRIIRPRLMIIPILCFLLLILYFINSFRSAPPERRKVDLENIRQISQRVYNSLSADNKCHLPQLTPWDTEVQKHFFKPDPLLNQCTPSLTMLTSLENGVLRINWRPSLFSWFSPSCYYRCLHPINDYKMKVDKWQQINKEKGSVPNCDIVEVYCQRYFWYNYRFLHTQIVEKPIKPENSTTKLSEYSLHWFIIDSVSSSMFRRGLTKTHKLIVDKFQAIEFPFLNKVPKNSRPNAMALLFGEQAYRISKNPFGITANNGTDLNDICRTPLEQFNYVGFDFQKAGYATLSTEDWGAGAVNWPNCVGFGGLQSDHHMRPFWLKVGAQTPDVDKWMTYQMYKLACKQGHSYLMENLLQFAGAYAGKPKFSLGWISEISHDDNANLFNFDAELADFFTKFYEKTRDSFVFFQADHGIRVGPVRDIPIIGELEDNNPFLFVIVPEKLRHNPSLMDQLRTNSRSLISQLDLYASAVQIAKFSHEWGRDTKFNKPPPPIHNRTFIGSSLFHPMKQPRNCDNLRIPFEYCICQQETFEMDEPELAQKVAQTIIDSINLQIDTSPYHKLCQHHRLSPDYPIRLEEYVQSNNETRILKAKFETLPGEALYQGLVQINADNSFTLISEDFPRLNIYADQAFCIPEGFFKNYCVCSK